MKLNNVLKRIAVLFLFVFICYGFILQLTVITFFPLNTYAKGFSSQFIAVLFHGFDDGGNGIDNETKRRIHHGLKICEANSACTLIMVGGNASYVQTSGATLMSRYADEIALTHVTDILTEDRSYDTITNLDRVFEMARQSGFLPLTIVSDPFHLWRIDQIGHHGQLVLSSYTIDHCEPEISRYEVILSMHANMLLVAARKAIPNRAYNGMIRWIRTNTRY